MWSVVLIFGAVILQVFDSVETTTAFNCRNSLISDEWRQMVLDEVNDRRRILALGQQVDNTTKFLPMAKNMNQLNWDCNLEWIAINGTNGDCSWWNDNNKNSKYIAAQANFKIKNCDIHSQTKLLLRAWWTEVERIDMKNDTKYVAPSRDFAMMARAETKQFACAYDVCKTKGTIVCIYDFTQGYDNKTVLYERAATKGEVCDSCKATCERYLCPQKSTPVTITPTCNDDKLTRDSNNAALWMHNYYRKLLASGWAKDPKAQSNYAPTAKEMRELKYDCAAAGVGAANGATNTYNAIKDCPSADPSASPGYAMNFMRIQNYTISEQDALEHAIKTWWSQLETVGLGGDTTYHANAGITSFAHMAYDKVEKVACAVQNCIRQGETLVMCQYDQEVPDGDKIYETGNVCGGCTRLGKQCSNPRGLCVSP